MRILLATYSAACHGSYGIVTREIWKRLAKRNPTWEILQHGWFHHGNFEKVPWNIEPTARIKDEKGRTRPDPEDRYGQLTFGTVVQNFRPDVVWTLSDPYMCDYMGGFRAQHNFKLVKHCPVDGAPLPPTWKAGLGDCDLLVPITHYAARVFSGLLGHNAEQAAELDQNVIYHGVDLNRFPATETDRSKRVLGQDTFMLGYCGLSQFRKQTWVPFLVLRHLIDGAYWIGPDMQVVPDLYDETTRSFTRLERPKGFQRATPIKAGMWVHSRQDDGGAFYPINGLRQFYGVEEAVFKSMLPSALQGVPDDSMQDFYSGIDVLMMLSGAEGFGLPIIEAYASNVPVVYTKYGSLAEIGAYAGCPVDPMVVMPQPNTLTGRAIANIGQAITEILKIRKDGPRNTRTIAKEVFDIEKIVDQWEHLLKQKARPNKIATVGISI